MMAVTPQLPFDIEGEDSDLAVWFRAYLKDHPQVWVEFERRALAMVRSGHRLGAKAVAESIRWEMLVEKGRDGFRINNTAVSFLARRFHREHPELGKVFETRERRGGAA